MVRAFSSTTSGIVSCLSSSHAIQNSMFSSLYSDRRNALKSWRPAAQGHVTSKEYVPQAIASKITVATTSTVVSTVVVIIIELKSSVSIELWMHNFNFYTPLGMLFGAMRYILSFGVSLPCLPLGLLRKLWACVTSKRDVCDDSRQE